MRPTERARAERRAVVKAAANILAMYLDADDATRAAGHEWYMLEAQRCADFAARHKLVARAVAGAAAAISPGLRWEHTFAYLEALVRNPKAKVPTYCLENVRRAVRCLRGEDPATVLSGPKVTAFYALLAGVSSDVVVIDGHAWNIARGEYCVFRSREGYSTPVTARVTPFRYRITAAAFREVAELVGAAPHQVQAATWIHWRNLTARGA